MLYILCALLGLAIGSFLNVVIWRLPQGMSISHPPSACPRCQRGIKWYENIPVLSWVALRGKCRGCKLPISIRYPLIEIVSAIVFIGVVAKFSSTLWAATDLLVLLPYFYLGAIGVALAMIDLDTHKLPNKIVLPSYLVIAALLWAATAGYAFTLTDLMRAGIAGLALYAFYFILLIVGGMGFGDVKLAGVLGMGLGFLGWEYVIVGAFLPFVFGGLFSVALIVLRKAGRKSGIPFGPWMVLGSFAAFTWAPSLTSWYLGTFF